MSVVGWKDETKNRSNYLNKTKCLFQRSTILLFLKKMKKFDLDVESLSTQKNRTIVEQRRVETMIQQLYSEILAKEMKYREKQHM